MSIPSIHAEKVADIRFRNEREREGGKEGRKEGFFICIFVPLPPPTSVQGLAKRRALGCVNPAFWLPLAAGGASSRNLGPAF